MSSSAPRGPDRMVHQDYIVRVRYSNALPPPPNPPKLQDIPNDGLAVYTTPKYASRIARDQPLNIEADAELGMPLDLVGMPGIFDGDESSIQAPLTLPIPHPHDRVLLRPLSTLGKPKFSDTGVSFLRRTEYISSYTSKSRFESTTSRSLIDNVGNKKKRPSHNIDKESPEYIKEQVEKSFQTAVQNLKNKSLARHPTKKNLQLVDAYPLLPDVDAFPEAGGYVTLKFVTNPVPPSESYDTRLENSLLVPMVPSDEEAAMKEAQKAAYEKDPDSNPPPDNTIEYEFYLPETNETAHNFKRKFDILDNDHQSADLYTETSGAQPCFRFKRVRAYETEKSTGNVTDKYDEEVVIALHDGKDGRLQKGAYYYPLVQRASIRPQRQKNIDKRMGRMVNENEEKPTDFMDIRVGDPDQNEIDQRNEFRDYPYGKDGEEDADGEGEEVRESVEDNLSPNSGDD
ncbi:RNA polymerase II-associated [Amylocarpus encephaloides]|uniref:RNA polymerase II-associated n=1 Tax=Amylocarpus encephaloides TaxID=45428 RepID=A0A9P7YLU2_9HELO|nr:RNA polymerase II-associated [Amylocarpus encephaloides]